MELQKQKKMVRMHVLPDGVALIIISHPPVNSLSIPVYKSLRTTYEEALARDDVKAIVLTGEKGMFSGGFDINALKDFQQKGNLSELSFISLDLQTKLIEGASKPSVAAIQGTALGGGLELSMCCHARIASPKARFGLPELQLGLIPGGGGTQRLPRLVGLTKALEMLLSTKSVASKEAMELGLIDAVVPDEELITTARNLALDIANFRRPWLRTLYRTDKLEPFGEARKILKFSRERSKRQAKNVTHPQICIDVIEEGIVSGGLAGILKEEAGFQHCLSSSTAKALVHVFLAQRATVKVQGISDLGLTPRVVKRVGVVGGGLMGSGIATACILNGISVVLKEVNPVFLQAGLDRVKANLQSRLKKGRMTQEKFTKTLALIEGVLDYEPFQNVDVVIEAVIENPKLKQQIFKDLEKFCSPECVLASNTSTIDLNVIGEHIQGKERIAGAHFFSPAHVMALFEIIRTESTSPQVLLDLLEFGKTIKKIPIVVGNCAGFAVNRTFFPYTQAALLLVDLGVDVYDIDNAITSFGMPMGPFRLADLVGFEVGVASGGTYIQAYPDRVYKSLLFPMLIEDKRLGERTGKGFYAYDNGRKARPDPELRKYLEKSRSLASIKAQHKLSEWDIIEMVFFPVVNEACRVLEEGVVSKASDLDIASIMGMGFPSYRGGLVFWADSLGAAHIASTLTRLTHHYGEFFKPCSYLKHCASEGLQLSSPLNNRQSRL